MVSVDQAYMVGHMKNADGSINNKNVVLSAACEPLFMRWGMMKALLVICMLVTRRPEIIIWTK